MTANLPADDEVIELAEESVFIDKRVVETGRVRVRTEVDSEDVILRNALVRENVEVERVAMSREVAVAPKIRDDGEFLVIPIIEERLVVEKKLFLVEEIRIRRSSITVPVEVPVKRRAMRAVVERSQNSSVNPSTERGE